MDNLVIDNNSTVKINYISFYREGDGEFIEYENTYDKDPIEFKMSDINILYSLKEHLKNKTLNDKISVVIDKSMGYGEYNENAITKIKKEDIPKDLSITVGGFINGKTKSGKEITVKVLEINKDTYTVDLNHPLSGKDLKFEGEIIEIK